MGVMVIKTPIFARMCYTVSFCREGLASYNIIIHYVYTLFIFSKVYIENVCCSPFNKLFIRIYLHYRLVKLYVTCYIVLLDNVRYVQVLTNNVCLCSVLF